MSCPLNAAHVDDMGCLMSCTRAHWVGRRRASTLTARLAAQRRHKHRKAWSEISKSAFRVRTFCLMSSMRRRAGAAICLEGFAFRVRAFRDGPLKVRALRVGASRAARVSLRSADEKYSCTSAVYQPSTVCGTMKRYGQFRIFSSSVSFITHTCCISAVYCVRVSSERCGNPKERGEGPPDALDGLDEDGAQHLMHHDDGELLRRQHNQDRSVHGPPPLGPHVLCARAKGDRLREKETEIEKRSDCSCVCVGVWVCAWVGRWVCACVRVCVPASEPCSL